METCMIGVIQKTNKQSSGTDDYAKAAFSIFIPLKLVLSGTSRNLVLVICAMNN